MAIQGTICSSGIRGTSVSSSASCFQKLWTSNSASRVNLKITLPESVYPKRGRLEEDVLIIGENLLNLNDLPDPRAYAFLPRKEKSHQTLPEDIILGEKKTSSS